MKSERFKALPDSFSRMEAGFQKQADKHLKPMMKKIDSREEYKLAALALIALASTFFFYLPFLVQADYIVLPQFKMQANTFETIYRHWDGPTYAVVAKQFYDIQQNPFANLTPQYYAAHLIGYPLAIRVFSFLGYLNGMLAATALFTVLSVLIFYKICKDFAYTKHPFFLAALFTFLPPRWLTYHSIGASEAMFVFFSLLSFYFYKKENHFLAGVAGAVAAVTRIFGVLLFPLYIGLLLLERKKIVNAIPYALIPMALAFQFYWFQLSYGNFWAYFNVNAGWFDYHTPFKAMYSYIFRTPANEFFLWIYAITAFGVARVWNKDKALGAFALIFVLPVVFINHNDISRYLIPAAPFALLIAFEDLLTSKEFKYALPVIIAITYLNAWTFAASDIGHLVPQYLWEPAKKIIMGW